MKWRVIPAPLAAQSVTAGYSTRLRVRDTWSWTKASTCCSARIADDWATKASVVHTRKMKSTGATETPSWSLQRVVALLGLGVVAGGVLGIIVSGVLVLASRPDASAPGAVTSGLFTLFVGGMAGGVVAFTAGIGAFSGLVIFDHWGESRPSRRFVIAACGAAAATGLLLSVVSLGGVFDVGVMLIAVAAASSGCIAGFGLRRFERHLL